MVKCICICTKFNAKWSAALAQALQIIFVDYDQNSEEVIRYDPLCTTMGWLVLYTSWVKLLFTMWVTFHIFCFAVLHKNLKKLEVLYVVTSLLVPVVIAAVPLITGTYGQDPNIGSCWIEVENKHSDQQVNVVAIETYALWDGPAMIILVAASIAMSVMVTKLAHTVWRRSTYRSLEGDDPFWKALKHLIPLAVFPILFFIFEIPVFIFHVYVGQHSRSIGGILISRSAEICFSLWSMASGAVLIIHIAVAKMCGRKHRHNNWVAYVYMYLYLLLVAVVPQITHSYGFSKIDGCSIPAYKQSANSTRYGYGLLSSKDFLSWKVQHYASFWHRHPP